MNEDRILEFMSTVSEYMRNSDRRYEQMISVMHDGFGRVADKLDVLTERVDVLTDRVDVLTERVDVLTGRVDVLTGRVDVLTGRVDVLTEEVRELKEDVRELNVRVTSIEHRLSSTFQQTGVLTEQAVLTYERLSQVEEGQVPTNSELDARVRAIEEQLRQAS